MGWIRGAVIAALLTSLTAGPGFAEESMRILTYPLGLVVGELEVEADLGGETEARPTCSSTGSKSAR